jgi:predicted RNA-binding protein with PIN domain
MARHLIVDGYNLAHALSTTRGLIRSDRQAVRQTLIDLLRRYKKAVRSEITVVFDGADQPGGHGGRSAGITVIFSRPPQSADDRIRALVNGARDPGKLLVVSSDREVWRHARNKGAEIITSQAFGDRLFVALQKQSVDMEKPHEVDMKKWQRIFGLTDSEPE